MSYILQALQRANAERERANGQAPTLTSQGQAAATAQTAQQPRKAAWWLGGVGLALALALALAWWLSARPAPVPAALPAAAPSAVPQQVLQAVANAASSEPSQPSPSAPTSVRAAPTVPPPPAPPAAPAIAATVAPKPAAPPPAPTIPSPSPPAVTAAAPSAAPILPLRELPEDLRSSIPKLTVNGAVYANAPAERLLIVNGQPLREGESLAPDLVLEQIRAKSAVWRIKSTRFLIDF